MYLEKRNGSTVLDGEGVDEPVVVLVAVVAAFTLATFFLFAILAHNGGFAVEGRLLTVHDILGHGVCPVRIPEVVQLQANDGPGELTDQGVEDPSDQLERLN